MGNGDTATTNNNGLATLLIELKQTPLGLFDYDPYLSMTVWKDSQYISNPRAIKITY